jgi:DNA polymerase III delta prime subunit
MSTSSTEFLWVEKYRPQVISDCVLPERLKATFTEIVQKGQLHNLILSAGPGTGKTTIAKALCKELGCDWIIVNASEDCGIDVLRQRIKQFASTVSLGGVGSAPKVVILDEADYLNGNVQAALRGFMEEFSANCRFILTCNFKNRIIEPLHSRCAVIDFNITKGELAKSASGFSKRLRKILTDEGVKFDPKLVGELIVKFAPDWRRVINECQRSSTSGELQITALCSAANESIAELVTFVKTKDFKSMRGWVAQHSDIDSTTIFRSIYDGLYEYAQPASIPQAVLIIADYSYKSSFVVDKEINTAAALVELMTLDWK